MIEVKALKITGWKAGLDPSGHLKIREAASLQQKESKKGPIPSQRPVTLRVWLLNTKTLIRHAAFDANNLLGPIGYRGTQFAKSANAKTHRRVGVSLTRDLLYWRDGPLGSLQQGNPRR